MVWLSGEAYRNSKESYDVGYKKPPKGSQFKKGQSGNRKGRPKGARALKTIILEDLDMRVTVRVNGKTKRVSKLELFVQTISAEALKGDPRARALYYELIKLVQRPDEQEADAPLSPEDQAMLDRFVARMEEQAPPANDTTQEDPDGENPNDGLEPA